MRNLTYSTVVGGLILGLCCVTGATASVISGSYTYGFTGDTASSACQSGYGVPDQDNFASNGGGNSIAADPVVFSDCHGTPGFLDDGVFSIINGVNVLEGTFSGTEVGANGSGPGGGNIYEGTISITTATGYYAGVAGEPGVFEVITGDYSIPADFATGTIEFQSTPEPATAAFAGSGLLLLGLFRKFVKRRA